MTAHLLLCGLGAALAVVGHFPRRPPLWVPHAVGLAAMAVAWLPAPTRTGWGMALLVLGAVLVWQIWPGHQARTRRTGAVDTAAMAALIALSYTAATTGGTATASMHLHHDAGLGRLPWGLGVLVVWSAVRVALDRRPPVAHGPRTGQDRTVSAELSSTSTTSLAWARPTPSTVPWPAVVRTAGGVVMLSAMTAMLT